MLHGVIFDVDGTLVDSNEQHAMAFEEAFREFGYAIPFEKIRPLIGMGGDKLIPAALEREVDDDEVKAIGDLKSKIFERKYLETVKPFPKVRELLQKLSDCKLHLGIATSASKDEVRKLLKRGELEEFFEAITTADDAENSKPDPDILCEAMKKLDIEADEAIMVGDTPYDIEAAKRAGLKVIAFRSGGSKDALLEDAFKIYDGPWEMLAEM